jgi:hypothetical protein
MEIFIFGRRYQDGDVVAAMKYFFPVSSKFSMIRSGHDERKNKFQISLSFFGSRKKKKKDTSKKFLNSAYMNVGRRSLGTSVLRPFAECLPVWSSMLQSVV